LASTSRVCRKATELFWLEEEDGKEEAEGRDEEVVDVDDDENKFAKKPDMLSFCCAVAGAVAVAAGAAAGPAVLLLPFKPRKPRALASVKTVSACASREVPALLPPPLSLDKEEGEIGEQTEEDKSEVADEVPSSSPSASSPTSSCASASACSACSACSAKTSFT